MITLCMLAQLLIIAVSLQAFKTIMSYFCPDDRRKSTEVGLFSNPNVEVFGNPSGNKDIGDCARAIRETASKVADYRQSVPKPSPPPPLPAKLALISSLINGFKEPGGNLSANSLEGSDSCSIPFSPVLGLNNITVTQPGRGSCGSLLSPGNYTLEQEPPLGMSFINWTCSLTTRGYDLPQNVRQNIVEMKAGSSWTCVANYEKDNSPAPTPRYAKVQLNFSRHAQDHPANDLHLIEAYRPLC
jgi:hypothetical protein